MEEAAGGGSFQCKYRPSGSIGETWGTIARNVSGALNATGSSVGGRAGGAYSWFIVPYGRINQAHRAGTGLGAVRQDGVCGSSVFGAHSRAVGLVQRRARPPPRRRTGSRRACWSTAAPIEMEW